MEAVEEGFMLVRDTEAAAEVKDGVIIVQGKAAEELFQFLKTVADFWRIGFVGLCIGLVQLIQDSFAIAVTGIKGVSLYVDFQSFCDLIHDGTSWLAGALPEAR